MNQKQRLVAASIHLVVLVAVSLALFGRPFPVFGAEGVWFYAGLAMLLLTTALAEPFFARPADVLINSVAALLVAASFPSTAGAVEGASTQTIELGKVVFAVVSILIGTVAAIAIFTKDGKYSSLSALLTRIARTTGSARAIFSAVFLLASYAAYSRAGYVMATLFLTWILVAVVRPGDFIARLPWKQLKSEDRGVASVVALRHPGLVEIHAPDTRTVKAGDAVRFLGDQEVVGVVLDTSASEAGLWGLVAVAGEALPSIGSAVVTVKQQGTRELMVGAVEPGTTIETVCFRAPGNVDRLKEGSVVRIALRERPVLYQVVRAVVRKESLSAPTEHRYLEIDAHKIGEWQGSVSRFQSVPWLPQAGEAVFVEAAESSSMDASYVGRIPEMHFGIRVDPDLLVTHNTAILGILGIGKTYLCFELVRRILLAGRKVIVLDVTGQYAPEFADVFPPDEEAKAAAGVNQAIATNRNRVMQNVHEGGNFLDFRRAIRADLEQFLGGPQRLRICNPAAFDVVRQDSKPFQGTASMAPLTTAEVTRWIAEELLAAMATQITPEARVCVVLEEAHGLVPEWNSTTYEGDQRASNGTARAVLQGRKYGLGVILVTQRTANVTKTILNQCNTVFALRTFDATGMEFLRNYVGPEYSGVLSALEERTAVLFGRASSCENPVIVQLNEHDEIVDTLWRTGFEALTEPGAEVDDEGPVGEEGFDFEPPWSHAAVNWEMDLWTGDPLADDDYPFK